MLLTIPEIVAVIGAILAFYSKNVIWSLNVNSKHDLLYQFWIKSQNKSKVLHRTHDFIKMTSYTKWFALESYLLSFLYENWKW